jgi:hypothetical protein
VSALFVAVNANHPLGLLVAALSSVFWTLTYALIIARGARDRTCGMPVPALAANLSWEVIFLVVTLSHGAFDARLALLLPWTLLDLAILVQCFRHGPRDCPDPWLAKHFPAALLGILALAAAVLLAFVRELPDAVGWYAAFGQNLMMSVLFVTRLQRRGDLRGQSIHIALAKLLGTLFAFILAVFWSPPSLREHWTELLPERYSPVSPLIVVLYSGIFAFDVLYVALVHRRSRELGLDPWSGRAPSVSCAAALAMDRRME